MKISNKINVIVISTFLTMTFSAPIISAALTKDQCEQMCSDQQCRTEIWGACKAPKLSAPCPSTSILTKCEACRSIASDVVEHCWNIYRNGAHYQSH